MSSRRARKERGKLADMLPLENLGEVSFLGVARRARDNVVATEGNEKLGSLHTCIHTVGCAVWRRTRLLLAEVLSGYGHEDKATAACPAVGFKS